MFTVTGNPKMYSFWKKIHDYSYTCLKKHENKNIDVSLVMLPTPSTMIIKFSVLNTGKKYELVVQGKYAELFKRFHEGDHITPESVNAELLVKSYLKEAYEIN